MTIRPHNVRAQGRWIVPLFICGFHVGTFGLTHRALGQSGPPAGAEATPPVGANPGVGADPANPNAAGEAMVPVIPLQVDGCRVDEMNEVRRLLKIELEADVIGADAATQADPKAVGVRVKVICRGAEYRIFVVDADPERTRTRELDLSSTGTRARARFVALSIVEAMTTLPKPLEPSATAAVAPTPSAAPVAVVAVPPVVEEPPAVSTEALVQAVGRYFPATSRANAGFGVMLSHDLRRSLSLDVDLTGEGGRQVLDEGDLNILAASIGAAASYVHRQKDFSFRAGGGVRLGGAQITGVAANPMSTAEDAFAGPWGGPFLSASVGALLGDTCVLRIGAEAGHSLVETTGNVRIQGKDGTTVLAGSGGVEGPWLALVVSAGWQP